LSHYIIFLTESRPTLNHTPSLHDALPISLPTAHCPLPIAHSPPPHLTTTGVSFSSIPSAASRYRGFPSVFRNAGAAAATSTRRIDRKSTRLNSSHVKNSYAVFCLKKKKNK